MAKKSVDLSLNDHDEKALLTALMSRIEAEAKSRGILPSTLVLKIIKDNKAWAELERRLHHLDGTAVQPERTRSISLDMRDRLLAGCAKREAEKPAA